jgi:DNA-binding NarL/FixJ family response regulator
MKKINLALFDEKTLTGEFFYSGFNYDDRMDALFMAVNESALTEKLQFMNPDVLFMHVRPDKLKHRNLLHQLKKKFPHVPVLVLLINYEPTPEEVVALISAGVKGIITDVYSYEGIFNAVTDIVLNGMHYNHLCSASLFARCNRKNTFRYSDNPEIFFSERESRIIALKKEGKTSIEVGTLLYISDRTVDNILSKLYERLHCHNILELITRHNQHVLNLTH